MKAEQNNKLAMYGSVAELLKTSPEINAVAGLSAKLAALTAKLGDLRTLAGTQAQPTAGQTAARDQQLESMIDTTLEIAGIVGTYAHDHALPEQSALVDVQRSDFRAGRLVQQPLLAQRVHDAAAGVLPQLGAWNVTAETLGAFQAQIDAMRTRLNQPRMTVVAKRAATKQLASAFAGLDALLTEQIDRLVLPLRKTSPSFYAQYQAARRIGKVLGVRHGAAPVVATASPASGGVPIAHAALPIAQLKAA